MMQQMKINMRVVNTSALRLMKFWGGGHVVRRDWMTFSGQLQVATLLDEQEIDPEVRAVVARVLPGLRQGQSVDIDDMVQAERERWEQLDRLYADVLPLAPRPAWWVLAWGGQE